MAKWDTFISHASEDKKAVARPLATMLERRGLKVWLDENEVKLGQSLPAKIDRGLAESDFGVVILSSAFFKKHWTMLELDALVNRSVHREKALILVLHEMSRDDLLTQSPILASKFAANTADGLDIVASQIVQVVRPAKPVDLPTFEERQGLAADFVQKLRSREWTGGSFSNDIGRATMNLIRALLLSSDSAVLLELITDTRQRPGIRNRAASLVFGDRLQDDASESERVRVALREYYEKSVETDQWQVLRAVALAVADQVNDARLISDWLRRIRHDDGMLEANLAMSDEYHSGRKMAVEVYIRRIAEQFRQCPAGRYWEVFYLGRRGVYGDKDLIAVLNECGQRADDAELSALCEESLRLLGS